MSRTHHPVIRQLPNGTWLVDYRNAGVRHRKFNFPTKSQAAVFSKTIVDIPVVPAQERTVADYAPVYLALTEGKSSHRTIRLLIERYVLPFFGTRTLASLNRADRGLFLEYLKSQHLAPGTQRGVWTFLMALINSAVDDDVIPANRLKGTKGVALPRGDARERVFTTDELSRLFKCSPPKEQATWLFLLNTGLRPGKILELTAEMLTDTPMRGINLPVPRTTTKSTPRWMPLNTLAYGAVQKQAGTGGRRLFRYANEAMLYQTLRAVAARAGLLDVQVRDFRRTFSNRLQDLGCDYLVRERLLGHSVGLSRNYVPEQDPRFRLQMQTAVEKLGGEFGQLAIDWQSSVDHL